MHGAVNKAIEWYITDTYTRAVWDGIAREARLKSPSFEAMLAYEPRVTERVIEAAVARIGKPRDALLEDLGIYLVSHPRYEGLRRLLRFAGVTFEDFVLSIDELQDRARLALPDLDLGPIRVSVLGASRYRVCCGSGWTGFPQVLAGGIRAMADDYGALVTLALLPEAEDGLAAIELTLHAPHHTTGRPFDLAARTG